MMVIIDDVIPKSLQDAIENTLFGQDFPWFFINNITFKNGAYNTPAFFHVYKTLNGPINSNTFDLVSLIAHAALEKTTSYFGEVLQARSFLQLPLNHAVLSSPVDELHIDCETPHIVVLYYVCDSDGDTILVDKKFNPAIGAELTCKHTDYEVLARVTPKKGRAVVFDGAIYHTAEQPTKNKRCIVNFNLRGELRKNV